MLNAPALGSTGFSRLPQLALVMVSGRSGLVPVECLTPQTMESELMSDDPSISIHLNDAAGFRPVERVEEVEHTLDA